jgi:hypothetical protein
MLSVESPLLAACFMFVSCLAYSNLTMEATYFAETSVDSQRTTQRYIAGDRILFVH